MQPDTRAHCGMRSRGQTFTIAATLPIFLSLVPHTRQPNHLEWHTLQGMVWSKARGKAGKRDTWASNIAHFCVMVPRTHCKTYKLGFWYAGGGGLA